MDDPNGSVAASRDYLARRAAKERALAATATDPSARCAHQAMADRYAELLNAELTAA